MESNAPFSSQLEDQALTTTPSSPEATQSTRRTIQDYFAASSSMTRQSSISESFLTADEPSTSSQLTNTSDKPPKKFKITANNGKAVVMRQPGRKKVKKEISFDGGGEDEKMTKITHSRRHNSRAKLRMLPFFPLDVIFEIFSHLLPIDLLHLTRATKDIRAILLHRSASCVWKSALSNVPDLPQCPDDVPLPQWANLAFDTFCQNCLAPNVRSVNFHLRVRYCNKCVKTKLLADCSFNSKKNLKDELILRGVPFSKWNERPDTYCTIAAKDEFLTELSAGRGDTTVFMRQRIEALKLRLEHAKKCKAWFEGLIDRREAELDEIRYDRAVRITQKLKDAGFEAELSFLTSFAEGICAIRPWPRSVILFDDHPHVKVPKPLTDKGWDRIKDDVFTYMKGIRILVAKNARALLERKRRVAFHTAYVNWRCLPKILVRYPSDEFMPGPADILKDPDVEHMVEAPGIHEYDLTVATEMLDREINLREFVSTWHSENISKLFEKAEMVGPYEHRFKAEWPQWTFWNRPHLSQKLTLMRSAICVFQCAHEGVHWRYEITRMEEEGEDHNAPSCLWYPEFFFHPCTSMVHFSMDENFTKDNKNLSLEKQFRGMRRDPWNVERLKFDHRASRTVKRLLDAAALDYGTTVERMDELNHRFVCLKCSFGARCDGLRKVRVWSWRDAVQHCLKAHFGDSRVTWECLYPEDTQKVLTLQAVEHTKRGYPAVNACKMWKCMRCRDTSSESRRMTMAELRVHFLEKPKHGDVDDIDKGEGVLYYKARDYSPRELAPVKMAPDAHEPIQPTPKPSWLDIFL